MKKIVLLLGILSVFLLDSCASAKPTANLEVLEPDSIVMMGNSTLIVQRKRAYFGVLTKMRIILDNKEVGSLRNGESIEFTIPNGYHKIHIEGGGAFSASNEITFNASSKEITFLIGYAGFGLDIVKTKEEDLKNAAIAYGSKVLNVAVVETEADLQSGVSNEISKAEVREITAELRRQAVKYLPKERYNIMTSETIQAQGSAVLKECSGENCVITLGAKIGADFIVRGTISKFQKLFTLTVEIYDTEDGNLVASSDAIRSENIIDLIEKSSKTCADMYKTFTKTHDSNLQLAPKNTETTGKTQEKGRSLAMTTGLSFSQIYEKSDIQVSSASAVVNFQVGLTYYIFNSNLFNLQPGIVFIYKWAIYNEGDIGEYWENKDIYCWDSGNPSYSFPSCSYSRPDKINLYLYYIEFPVLLTCKLSKLRFDAGPYVSLLLGGSAEYDSGSNTKAEDLYKTWDYGLRIGGGYDFGMVYLGIFSNFGMANVSKVDGFTVNNRSYGLIVEYPF